MMTNCGGGALVASSVALFFDITPIFKALLADANLRHAGSEPPSRRCFFQYAGPMMLLGVTGGVGMGKSTAADLFARHGFAVIDTDALAREIVQPGQPALAEIQKTFGSGVIDPQGALRRDAMAARVFADESERRKLEAILHPRIRQRWLAEVARLRAAGWQRVAVVIPLLFETQAQTSFDATICVACSAEAQRQRLSARGWSDEHIRQRIAAQWPIERKVALADFLVWTDGDLDSHAAQIERIIAACAFPANA